MAYNIAGGHVIVDRYIARTIGGTSSVALLALVGLTALFTFIGEADDVGKGDYGLGAAALYVALLLPRLAYDFIPMAVLIGAMMGLGSLASANELTAMQAGGFSLQRLVRAVLQFGLFAMALALVLGEFLAPPLTREAVAQRVEARSQGISVDATTGFWARDGERFVQVEAVAPENSLESVSVFEFDGGRLRRMVAADSARYDGEEWVLAGLRESRLEGSSVVTRQADEERWSRLIDPALVGLLEVEPDTMSGRELHRYARYLEQNGLEHQRFELAFWIKMVAPFVPLVMLILAVPFAFGGLRATTGGQRLLIGILIGIVFYAVNRAMNHLGVVFELHPAVAALLPPLVFLAMGLLLINASSRR